MRQLFILLVPLAVACAPTHWAATFESHFENVMDLCLEDKHPEAGAKAAGLDVATYRKQVRAKLAEAERVFDNPEGESYLQFSHVAGLLTPNSLSLCHQASHTTSPTRLRFSPNGKVLWYGASNECL